MAFSLILLLCIVNPVAGARDSASGLKKKGGPSSGRLQASSRTQSIPEDIALLGKELLGSSADEILSQAKCFSFKVAQQHLQMCSNGHDDAAQRLPEEFSKRSDPYNIQRLEKIGASQTQGGISSSMLHSETSQDDQDGVSHNLVVDIGANLGTFTISAFLTNPQLRILALEPMPMTYTFLRWNLKNNNIPLLTEEQFRAGHAGVLALQRAVTKDGRDVKVEYSPSKTMNAITDASASSKGIPDKYDVQAPDDVKTSVHSLAIPSFVGNEPIAFLKLDCEGCEHEVVPTWKNNGFLSKVGMMTGEWHACLSDHSCRYSPDIVQQTKDALLNHPGWESWA